MKTSRLLVCAALAGLVGCSEGGSLDQRTQAALSTEGERVFGFELPSDWTATTGVTLGQSAQHTQGSFSMAVNSSGWVHVRRQANFGTLEQLDGRVSFDLYLNEAVSWGGVRLIMESPSGGRWYYEVPCDPTVPACNGSEIGLAGITPGQWAHLAFELPESVRSSFENKTDVDLRIIVNAPQGTRLLDNLAFGTLTGGGTGGSGSGGSGTGGGGGGSGGSATSERNAEILGFESLAGSSNSPSLGVALNEDAEGRYEGAASFAVTVPAGGTHDLTLAPLTTLADVGDTIGFFVRMPELDNEPITGAIQLFVSSNDLQLFNQWIGQVQLDGSLLHQGAFKRVQLRLPTNVSSALVGHTYDDLRFKIVFSGVPAGTYLLDRMSLIDEVPPVAPAAPSPVADTILSFADLSGWTASAGVMTGGDQLRGETLGDGSLCVSGASWTEVVSNRLSTLGALANDTDGPPEENAVTLAVALPKGAEPVVIQLYASIPSQNIYGVWIGNATSAPGPDPADESAPESEVQQPGLTFALPESLESAIEQAPYGDLQFRITVQNPNAPDAPLNKVCFDLLDLKHEEFNPAGSSQTRVRDFLVVLPPEVSWSEVARISGTGRPLWPTEGLGQIRLADDTAADAYGGPGGPRTLLPWRIAAQEPDPNWPDVVVGGSGSTSGGVIPSSSSSPYVVDPDTPLASLVTKGGAFVRFEPGDYQIGRLDLRAKSTIQLKNSGGAIRVFAAAGGSELDANMVAEDEETNNVFWLHPGQPGYVETWNDHLVVAKGHTFGTIVAPRVVHGVQDDAVGYESEHTGQTIAFATIPAVTQDYVALATQQAAACASDCTSTVGCPTVDADGDSLSDCFEEGDLLASTDHDTFNGLEFELRASCASMSCDGTSFGALDACLQSGTVQEGRTVAGWTRVDLDNGDVSTVACSGRMLPGAATCEPDPGVFDYRGAIRVDAGGRHCFRFVDASGSCSAASVGDEMLQQREVTCVELEAGHVPLRMSFTTAQSGSSYQKGIRLSYCYGGPADCVPQRPLPTGLLFESTDASESVPCGDNPLTCTDLCPCDEGASPCDDGNACTTDICNYPEPGLHHYVPIPDDGNRCTAECDPAIGVVEVAVDDSNACTFDSCHPDIGVVHEYPVDPNGPCVEEVSCSSGGQLQVVWKQAGTACGSGFECDGSYNCVRPGTEAPDNPFQTTADIAAQIPRTAIAGCSLEELDPKRAAIIVGRVSRELMPAGVIDPFAGVKVTAVGACFVGSTLSGADGEYRLAVNGGRPYRLRFEYENYLTSERTVNVGWDTTAAVDEVLLVLGSSNWKAIEMGDANTVATSALVSFDVVEDDPEVDGNERQAGLYLPAGRVIAAVDRDGNPIEFGGEFGPLKVAVTEYTTGPNGLQRMPAGLPPGTDYTYAMEIQAGSDTQTAEEVTFSEPVYYWVENYWKQRAGELQAFVDERFEIGRDLASWYYDRATGVWEPETDVSKEHKVDARSLEVIQTSPGVYGVNLDGVPGADSLDGQPLGLTQAEVDAIGQDPDRGEGIYLRLPLSRFSPHDINPPMVCPGGSCVDAQPVAVTSLGGLSCEPYEEPGSVIEVERQVLRERVAIPGSPYRLSYSSLRQPGYLAGRTMSTRTRIRVPPLPPQWDWYYGSRSDTFAVAGGLNYGEWCEAGAGCRVSWDDVVWDGLDLNGSPAYGAWTAPDRIVHTIVFVGPPSTGPGQVAFGPRVIEVPVPQERTFQLTYADDRVLGLGGWTLEPQHWYSAASRTVFRGDGRVTRGDTAVVERIRSRRGASTSGIESHDIVVLPDNSVLYTSTYQHTTHLYVANPPSGADTADLDLTPGQANGSNEQIRLAFDPAANRLLVFYRSHDGDTQSLFSYRRRSDGWFGNDCSPSDPDCVPYDMRYDLLAGTGNADDVAVAPDGTIVLLIRRSDESRELLRLSSDFEPLPAPKEFVPMGQNGNSLNPDQQKICSAGETCYRFGRTAAYVANGFGRTHTAHVAVGRDGTIWVATAERLLRYTPSEGYSRVAGAGGVDEEHLVVVEPDPLAANLGQIRGLMVDDEGPLVATTSGANQLYRYQVNANGVPGLSLVAGSYPNAPSNQARQLVPAEGAIFGTPAVAMGPDGQIWILEQQAIRRYSDRVPVARELIAGSDGYLVFDAGGEESYLFDSHGFHRQTRSVATGEVITSFEYDGEHHLQRVVDRGLETTLVHSPSEVTITAPGGQVTRLTMGPTGHLTRIEEVATGHSTLLSHDEGGMLRFLGDSRGDPHQFFYDDAGRLVRDNTAGEASQTIARDEETREVVHHSGEGEITRYNVGTNRNQSSITRQTSRPDGSTWSLATSSPNGGLERRTQTFSNGSKLVETFDSNPEVTGTYVREPRQTTLTLPGGGGLTTTRTTSTDGNVRTETVGGSTVTQVRNRTEQTLTTTTVLGRKVTVAYDELERVESVQSGSLLPLQLTYDGGRLGKTWRGSPPATSRQTEFEYFPAGQSAGGYLKKVDGPSRSVTFTRNEHGQVLTATFKQGNETVPGPTLSYDRLGNLIGVQQPAGDDHDQWFSGLNTLLWYKAPELEPGDPRYQTRFEHDRDRRLQEVVHPDGLSVEYVRSPQTDAQAARARAILGTDPWGDGSFATTLWYADETCGGSGSCNAPCELTVPVGNDPAICFDPRGRAEQLVEASRNGVSTEFFWNGPLQVAERMSGPTGGTSVKIQNGFNSRLQRDGRTLVGSNGDNPWIFSTSYGYDDDGVLISATVPPPSGATSGGGSVVHRFDCFNGDSSCSGHGLLESTLAGAVTQTYLHNDYGELARMTATATVSGTQVQLVDLTLDGGAGAERDGEGRITTRTETRGSDSRTTEYEYDARGQLALVKRSVPGQPSEVRRHIYDANGNRLCIVADAEATTCPSGQRATYDAQDRLAEGEDGTQYSYQERGTLLQAISPDGTTRTYGYDPMGNLLRVEIDRETGSDTSIEYQVDALGRRVGRQQGTTLRQYVWDGQLRIAATVLNGTVESEFVYTHQPSTPDLVRRDNDVYRIVSDERGTPLAGIHTETGEVWFEAEWDEWGNLTKLEIDGEAESASSYPIPQGFAGGLFDPITGLTRFGVRDYDPKVGRWTSKDPILFQGGQGNLYVYVGNDPVGFVDPEGESATIAVGGIMAVTCPGFLDQSEV